MLDWKEFHTKPVAGGVAGRESIGGCFVEPLVEHGHVLTNHHARGRLFGLTLSAIVVIVSLVALASGCGSSSTTPAASPSSPPAVQATTAIDPVWAVVGEADTPLTTQVVVYAPAFTAVERAYLLDFKTAWLALQTQASEYSTLVGTSAGSTQATDIVLSIEDTTAQWMRTPSPSARFVPFNKRVRIFVAGLNEMAVLSQQYEQATTADQKNAIAVQIVAVAPPLTIAAGDVIDAGTLLRLRFGHVPSPVVVVAASTTAPTAAPSSSPSSPPSSSPAPSPTQSPSTPTVTLTSAERNQTNELAATDAWLRGVIADTQTTLKDPLPWADNVVTSFCLNMGFLQDECGHWLNTPPAGRTVAHAYNEYRTGLKLVNEAAAQLNDAAQTGSNKKAKAGSDKLNKAMPYLNRGTSALNRLMASASGG